MLASQFTGLSLGASRGGCRMVGPSNGTASKLACKARLTFQVEVVVGNDEPQDAAMKRFRREVMAANILPEVRRRRHFENTAEVKKRKTRESRLKGKRGPVKSFGSVSGWGCGAARPPAPTPRPARPSTTAEGGAVLPRGAHCVRGETGGAIARTFRLPRPSESFGRGSCYSLIRFVSGYID